MWGEFAVQAQLYFRRTVAVVAVLVMAILAVAGGLKEAAAQEGTKVHLLTVVSNRDEVVIGLSEKEIPALASRPAVGLAADMLASQGRLSAWRYAPTRSDDGSVRLMPIYRVAIFAAGTVRLEPYVTEQEVVAPKE